MFNALLLQKSLLEYALGLEYHIFDSTALPVWIPEWLLYSRVYILVITIRVWMDLSSIFRNVNNLTSQLSKYDNLYQIIWQEFLNTMKYNLEEIKFDEIPSILIILINSILSLIENIHLTLIEWWAIVNYIFIGSRWLNFNARSCFKTNRNITMTMYTAANRLTKGYRQIMLLILPLEVKSQTSIWQLNNQMYVLKPIIRNLNIY